MFRASSDRITQGLRKSLLLAAFGASFLGVQSTCWADRPSAPKLFPDNTLGYIRVDDSRELQAKLKETSMGRLGEDPQIKPIIREFYGTLVDSLQEMQSQIGINLDELLRIPNGELAFAVVPTKTKPAVCLLLEAGDELPPVEILIGKLEDSMSAQGFAKQTKELAGVQLITWSNPNDDDEQVGYFIHSGCLVLSSRIDEAEILARTWTGNGIDFKPLADNRKFTNIMSRCVGAAGERPQVSFYVDPIAIVREVIKQNGNAAMVGAMLPVLGVDGIQGVGGSLILRPEEFDSITHMHLLLSNPRRVLLEVVRPKSGSTDPEEWVCEDVGSYVTGNWDVKKTLKAIEKIFDNFQGEGAFQEKGIRRISDQIGIDFEKEFLDQLADRFTLVQVFIRPAKINSGSNVFGIHLKDGKSFATDILPKFIEKTKAGRTQWESTTVADFVLYEITTRQPNSESVRAPQICLTVVGNTLLASDSRAAIEQAIYTYKGQNALLAESVEFKLVRDRIKRQLGDRETSIISYQRPEESLRLFYDLAADPANKTRVKEMSENNPMFRALSNALEKHKLPAFEVISKYLAPSGSFVFEDETGLHSTSFSLRREK